MNPSNPYYHIYLKRNQKGDMNPHMKHPIKDCNPATCKHKHEVVELKRKLQDSLSASNLFMSESITHINELKSSMEEANKILEEENKILKDKITLLETRNSELNQVATVQLNYIDEKLKVAEAGLVDLEKKSVNEGEKQDVFSRLYKNTRRTSIKPSIRDGKSTSSKASAQ